MPASLVHRLGLGNARAVANAEQEMLRRDLEDRIIADLVAALALRGVVNGSPEVHGAHGRRAESVSSAA